MSETSVLQNLAPENGLVGDSSLPLYCAAKRRSGVEDWSLQMTHLYLMATLGVKELTPIPPTEVHWLLPNLPLY